MDGTWVRQRELVKIALGGNGSSPYSCCLFLAQYSHFPVPPPPTPDQNPLERQTATQLMDHPFIMRHAGCGYGECGWFSLLL